MSESGDQPHKSRNNGSSGSTKVSRLGATLNDPSLMQRQTRLERDRLANAQSSRNGRNGHSSFGQSMNGNYERGLAAPTFEPSKPVEKGRKPRSTARGKAPDRNSATFWGLLFGRSSRRTSQKNKGDQTSDAVRLKAKTASFSSGHQSSKVSLSDQEGASKPKGVARMTLENGNGSNSLRSTPAKDTGRRSTTLLQSNVQSNIRDRYNQLLPNQTNGGSPGAKGTRSLMQAPALINGTGGPTSGRLPKREHASKPRPRGVSAALYAARMVILSVGVGVLAGTMLSMWDPASRSPAGASQQNKQASVAGNGTSNSGGTAAVGQIPKLGQEMTPLKAAIQTLTAKNPQMAPGVFILDLDKNAYIDINGEAAFSSASTIKVPILVAFLQDLDAGKIRLDEPLILRKELIGNGSGEMQYQPPGTRFTALETIIKMITISDNTATNLIIARLGGFNALNQRFKSWGMRSTVINQLLPDLQGTNTTSPRDMAILMTQISQGELISLRSRDRMLDIMRQTENRSQLPQGLGAGATIAHKTGDIGTMIGDVGLIDLPNGKRYAAVVLVKRSFNDDRAYEFVSQISRLAYQYFTRSMSTQANGTPAVTPSTSPISPTVSPSSPTGQYSPTPGSETLRTPGSPAIDSSEESGESESNESTTN
jgi:beta-lactamase class A